MNVLGYFLEQRINQDISSTKGENLRKKGKYYAKIERSGFQGVELYKSLDSDQAEDKYANIL
jgi:hypothetical protein